MGEYDDTFRTIAQELRVDTIFLAFDLSKPADLAPLRHVPRERNVVLSLVATEHGGEKDGEKARMALKEQIVDAARVMASNTGETTEEALERLALSPQCGGTISNELKEKNVNFACSRHRR